MDTIFALSSGRPPAAIAIVRVSGPDAFITAERMAGPLPASRRASLRTLRNANGEALDHALMIVFPAPNTATGEDLVEFHLHGGRAVVDAVETALRAAPNLRPALAGEFTRRALENGSLDLAQAQGLADLLAAETEAERKAAFAASEGEISYMVDGWLDQVAQASAIVEAALDYSDEEDVDADPGARVRPLLDLVVTSIKSVLARPTVERLRDGITVVLAGPPNAGKSSLFNAMVQRDAAIVTAQPGTTRDILEATVHRAGVNYRVIDTAGLRTDTDDVVERIGIDRAGRAVAGADLVLWQGNKADCPADAIAVHARADLPDRAAIPAGSWVTSVHDLSSIDRLWRHVEERASIIVPAVSGALLRRQQRERVASAYRHLVDASGEHDLLLVAEQLRQARSDLAALLGIDVTEALLDALFSRFCVGK